MDIVETVPPLTPYIQRASFSIPNTEKTDLLLRDLNALTEHHRRHSPAYARILEKLHFAGPSATIEDLPYLPVSLFKSHLLTSVPDSSVRNVLTSSGTTGQQLSKITVDSTTADRQARGLANSIQSVLGPKRLPMILVDTPSLLKDPSLMSARGAGVLGMMRFGHDHFFALDDHMHLNMSGLRAFCEKHGNGPFAIFGFTFMVWKYLIGSIEQAGDRLDLSNGILIHSGGWKKLADEAVDNATFKSRTTAATRIRHIYNFYGMVEQIGSIFLEGEDGLLYPPNFADVLVRNPLTWKPAELGEIGVIQVLSILPSSYPGHSLLTEDLGILHYVDRPDLSGGRLGKAITVIGRAPASELRGCSDVHAFGAPPV
jgi:Acyl-protein synthetase, LuxE